ncbi:MAG: hypothetical protein AABO58_19005 [Acidobacteriota bacterium]
MIAAVLCVCICRGVVDAQEVKCEPLMALEGSKTGYQKRSNRCEGLYVSNVSGRSLAAISFTLGSVRYELRASTHLQVSAPGQQSAVNVRAVAIPPKTYYRMDALLSPGSTMSWPVSDVLLPESLGDSRIGVFGWKGSEESKTLIPLRVVANGVPTKSASPLLTVQANFDAQQLKWRWAPAHEKQCGTFGAWQDAISQPVTASWPVRIDLSALPTGRHCVETAAQSGNSTAWAILKLRVEIMAR